jgi:hypothetical protein
LACTRPVRLKAPSDMRAFNFATLHAAPEICSRNVHSGVFDHPSQDRSKIKRSTWGIESAGRNANRATSSVRTPLDLASDESVGRVSDEKI